MSVRSSIVTLIHAGSVALRCASALLVSCGDESTTPEPEPVIVTPAEYGKPFDKLSDWHLFTDTKGPAQGVIPYEVIAPLFSDYTTKLRYVWVPKDKKVAFDADNEWDFPVGTVAIKTFAYRADLRDEKSKLTLLETRLLWREPEGWTGHTYVWNDEQTDAMREVAGATLPSVFINEKGDTIKNDYGVPNTNECKDCHSNNDAVNTLGIRTRQLDRDNDYGDGAINQIDHMAKLGLFKDEPPPHDARTRLVDPFGKDDVALRARSYLDSNCGSCHVKGGGATESALRLSFAETDPATNPEANWGVCKAPTSASGATCGNAVDIVPGEPDQSIMVCRLLSTDIEKRMPPVARRLTHDEGVALIREWISAMPKTGCTAN
jgi:uncharacterized repeat protein (TIGR03806 family)